MKRIKICALALSAGFILGGFAGCKKDSKEPDVTASEITETTLEHINVTSGSDDPEYAWPSEGGEVLDVSENPNPQGPAIEQSLTTDPTPVTIDPNIELDSAAQENANTFISNFAEVYFGDYDKKTSGKEQLFDFVYIHLKINSPDALSSAKKGDLSYETFTADKAREVILRYFSVSVSEDDCRKFSSPPDSFGDNAQGPYYENGRIWYNSGAGENYGIIAVVDSAISNSDGTVSFFFTIYSIDPATYADLSISGLKAYYKLTPAKADSDKTLTKVRSGSAVVSIEQSGRFSLVSYKTF